MKKRGRVFLIGAGPGDPELLTLKAVRMLGQAQIVLHDRLVSREILGMVPVGARLIDVGKAPGRHAMPQHEINGLMVGLALDGLSVARLKGGDPLLFGRASEEAEALHAAGIAVEIVSGITAAQAAAAVTGVPLTHRGLASGVRYVTGHCRDDRPLDLDWAGLADPDTTPVIYMGAGQIAAISARLIEHGLSPGTPVMAVASATTPRERRLVSALDRIAAEVAAAGLTAPVLFVVGRVVSLYRARPAEIVASLASARLSERVHA